MRSYIFQFSQPKARRLELTMDELLILDYLINFFEHSGKAKNKIARGKYFYWITYKKILEDLPILNFGYGRMRQIISKLQKLEIIEKLDDLQNSTKMFLHINEKALVEQDDDGLITAIGQDADLKYYIDSETYDSTKLFNLIKYNGTTFKYICPAIDTDFLKKYLESFSKILRAALQELICNAIFKMGLGNATIIVKEDHCISLALNNISEANMERNIYKIERAIVDSYKYLILSKRVDDFTKTITMQID